MRRLVAALFPSRLVGPRARRAQKFFEISSFSAAIRRPRGRERDAPLWLRGGSWNNNRNNCRSAYRNNNQPGNHNNNIGFRVVVGASTLHRQGRWMGIQRGNQGSPERVPAMRVTASKNKASPPRLVLSYPQG
ncbi:MAG: SUMF1/EgtB/PvdO family nonheme iron enzyme [Blastocatellia bacterium]